MKMFFCKNIYSSLVTCGFFHVTTIEVPGPCQGSGRWHSTEILRSECCGSQQQLANSSLGSATPQHHEREAGMSSDGRCWGHGDSSLSSPRSVAVRTPHTAHRGHTTHAHQSQVTPSTHISSLSGKVAENYCHLYLHILYFTDFLW